MLSLGLKLKIKKRGKACWAETADEEMTADCLWLEGQEGTDGERRLKVGTIKGEGG